MASSQYIKCGNPNHITKDCTNGWKVNEEEKKKPDNGNKKAAKVSTITATVEVVPRPIPHGRIISKDKLNFEVDELNTQWERRMSGISGHAVSQDWFSICVVRKDISVKEWKEKQEWQLMDIDLVLISSVSRDLSISQNAKRILK